MKLWEYMVLSDTELSKDEPIEDAFDFYGEAGWELVSAVLGDLTMIYFFKRKKKKKKEGK